MHLFMFSKECYFKSVPMANHMQIPAQQGEENTFIEGERKLGGLQQAKSLWLFIGWVLARKEEESFFSLLVSALAYKLHLIEFSSDYFLQSVEK